MESTNSIADIQYLDLGLLLANDTEPIQSDRFRADQELYIQEIAQKNLQLLANEIFQLPIEVTKGAEVVELPPPRMILPREKPIPKEKPMTKWEKYAKAKGIRKKKKEKRVWDEEAQEWKYSYGYKSKKNQKDWLMEVPKNADPNQDMFAKKLEEKKERIAKNEYQRLKNIAKGQKAAVADLRPSKNDLNAAIVTTRESTASVGKFNKILPQEKNLKKKGKKRKFESNFGNLEQENEKALHLFDTIAKKQPKLDVERAVNLHIKDEQEKNKNSEKKKKKPNLKKISRHQEYGKLAGRKGKAKNPKGNKKKKARLQALANKN